MSETSIKDNRHESVQDRELRIRERELSIKERAQDLAEAELHSKTSQKFDQRWTSPLVIAVLAAALAGISNAGVAVLNGKNQVELEQSKNKGQAELEELKSEAARTLEAIKTDSDPDKAAANLQFLVDAGLIENEKRRQKILDYLKQRKTGSGASLPGSSSSPGQSTPTIDYTNPNQQSGQGRVGITTGWVPAGSDMRAACTAMVPALSGYPTRTFTFLNAERIETRPGGARGFDRYSCQFLPSSP